MAESRTNQEWLHDLNARGMEQEIAIADLRTILLRAALYFSAVTWGNLQA